MGRLGAFTFTTLNGFYKGPNEDISWHHAIAGKEEADFAAEGSQSNSTLLFGRVTYEMMASWWPTPMAREQMPDVAKGMNASQKIVFSNSLTEATWENTRIVRGPITDEVRRLKQSEASLTILGSGSIVRELAAAGLIDEFMLMVDPVAIGEGTTLFGGLTHPLSLDLVSVRQFGSGALLLRYRPKLEAR